MRSTLLVVALLGACTVIPRTDDDAASLAQAERAFAAQSMRSDMVTAFLANFSDEGVLVNGGWARAQAALAGRPPPPIDLDWAPAHVEVAASGELGLSTGPWVRKSRKQPEAAAAHGHFVSIWRRADGEPWRVEVDLGISHPEPIAKPATVEVAPPAAASEGGESLEHAEAAFVQASMRSGPKAAYEAYAADRLLFDREGHAPFRGKRAALASGGIEERPTFWLADARSVSRSDEFGYVRGTFADAAEPANVRGYFLRVWRREGAAWRIVLDVTNAAR
jgi:hypothetical protein